MTEREKMAAGKLYDPFTEGMPEQRTRAHQLCSQYNCTTETDADKREAILNELLPNRGKNVYLQGPSQFDFGTNITIGDNCWIAAGVTICGNVTIGADSVIGAGSVVTRNIPPQQPRCRKPLPRHPSHYRKRPAGQPSGAFLRLLFLP